MRRIDIRLAGSAKVFITGLRDEKEFGLRFYGCCSQKSARAE
jgi:hypothetical protein